MNLCVKVGTGARTDVVSVVLGLFSRLKHEQIKEFLPWSEDRFTKGS